MEPWRPATHYATLGVGRDATDDQLKKQYKLLAKHHHPDRNRGDEAAAAERFKAVHEAWIADPENYELDILDVRDEIFDMVKPEVPGRITLEDLKRCGCADVVFEILCDHTGFWRYDNRESLPRDDEEEEEEEEEEAEEEDGGENAF